MRLQDLSKTFPRFRDPAKIFQNPHTIRHSYYPHQWYAHLCIPLVSLLFKMVRVTEGDTYLKGGGGAFWYYGLEGGCLLEHCYLPEEIQFTLLTHLYQIA